MNQPIPENTLALIKEALYRGEKIRAIKLHRQATGLGLAESKAEIDKLAATLHATSPEKFTASSSSSSSGKGCLAIIVVVGAIVGAVIWWLHR